MCGTNTTGKQSQDRLVGIATRIVSWTIQGLIPSRGRRFLSSAKCLTLARGCTCPPILCIPGVLSLGRVARA